MPESCRVLKKHLAALGESDIDVPMLEKYAVKDQVDLEIMERVRQAGAQGVFPKDVAKDSALGKYGLEYYDVSRRIVRMNKHLHFETGECLFEKHGHKWALTRFATEIWGSSKKELEEERIYETENG